MKDTHRGQGLRHQSHSRRLPSGSGHRGGQRPRSTPAAPSPRTAWAVSAAGLSTPVPEIPPAPPWNGCWPRWRTAGFSRAFSSGMAAGDCALRAVLRPGDHIVIPDDAYGGTFRLIDKVSNVSGASSTPRCTSPDLDAVGPPSPRAPG